MTTSKLVSRVLTLGISFMALLLLSSTVNSFSVIDQVALPGDQLELLPILTTPNASYLLSSLPTDVWGAHQVCQHKGGHLLTIQTPEELETLQNSIRNLPDVDIVIWSSAIRYRNATVENLLVWAHSHEPFPFPVVSSALEISGSGVGSLRKRRFAMRNRRGTDVSLELGDNHDKCPCPCPSTPPPPTPAPCKQPSCTGYQLSCTEKEPRSCLIARPPVCSAQEKNCTVDCGRPEDCRVIKQPVCEVLDSSRPRCRLELPNLGKCRTKPQNCSIVAPGQCRSHRVDCKQQPAPPCVPSVKPCKNPCSQQECTTFQPPCVTEQPPCVTSPSPTSCPPNPPSQECFARCKRSTTDKEDRFKCEQECTNTTPTNCGGTVTCPPPVTVCPPPVSSCSRPFVDCSPLVCQSNVLICPTPEINCPPPTIVCDNPLVRCEDPEVDCPEAEVICDEPEVKCSKPVIKCPDPVVHCDPIITTCEPAPFICSDPVLDCPDPVLECGQPTICPVHPPPENGGGNGGCSCTGCGGGGGGGGKGMKKSKRGVLVPEEMEDHGKTECIALQITGSGEIQWVAKSCDLRHRFICKM